MYNERVKGGFYMQQQILLKTEKLCKTFSNGGQQQPVELMRQLRLKQARHLLTTTSRSISEIAYEVGFSSPAYFTKCYRTAFGETPSELRENLAL